MRKTFGKVLAKLMNEDKSIYLIVSDYGYKTFPDIEKENPAHFINLGLTEQATISIAAGMALEGLKPYVYGIAPFLLKRAYEQVEIDLVEQKANVKIIGAGDFIGGGPTHNIKDINLLCASLGIELIRPKSPEETEQEILRISKINKPFMVYLSRS